MPEEDVVVRGLVFPFGIDATKLALFRAFSRFGQIVVLHVTGNSALLTFAASQSAQQAYLEMNGYVMFGSALSVGVTPVDDTGASVALQLTSTPSPLIAVGNCDASWLAVALRRVRGIELIEETAKRFVIVKCSTVDVATDVSSALVGLVHPKLGLLDVSFARKRETSLLT